MMHPRGPTPSTWPSPVPPPPGNNSGHAPASHNVRRITGSKPRQTVYLPSTSNRMAGCQYRQTFIGKTYRTVVRRVTPCTERYTQV